MRWWLWPGHCPQGPVSWCHQPQLTLLPPVTKDGVISISANNSWHDTPACRAVSPCRRAHTLSRSPKHGPDKTTWQPGNDISMIGAQQDPGHNLRDVDNLSSMSIQLASLPSSPGVMITHNRFHPEPGPGQKSNIPATGGHLQQTVSYLFISHCRLLLPHLCSLLLPHDINDISWEHLSYPGHNLSWGAAWLTCYLARHRLTTEHQGMWPGHSHYQDRAPNKPGVGILRPSGPTRFTKICRY